MKDLKKRILQAIEEGNLFDFIANNYWQMSKEELASVCKEALYAGHQLTHTSNGTPEYMEHLKENIQENMTDDE